VGPLRCTKDGTSCQHTSLRAVERDKTIVLSISGFMSKLVLCTCNAWKDSISRTRPKDRKHRGLQRHPAATVRRMERSIRSMAKKVYSFLGGRDNALRIEPHRWIIIPRLHLPCSSGAWMNPNQSIVLSVANHFRHLPLIA